MGMSAEAWIALGVGAASIFSTIFVVCYQAGRVNEKIENLGASVSNAVEALTAHAAEDDKRFDQITNKVDHHATEIAEIKGRGSVVNVNLQRGTRQDDSGGYRTQPQ